MTRETRLLALAPNHQAAYVEIVAGRRNSKPGKLQAIRDVAERGARPYALVDGIAIIGIRGVLVANYPYIGADWATGYDALRYQFLTAFDDTEVRSIVLDIASGGGEVTGLFDLVDFISAGKQQKPIAAILSECAYSAAFALATTADSISVPRTGGVGSVGVVALHLDWSKALEEFGVKPTLIFAGKHKVDGNPFEPLPDEVREGWQAEIDGLRSLFAETVARNRAAAGHKIDASAVLGTEAAVFEGPERLKEALKLGFADAILSPSEAFSRFRAFVGTAQH